MQRKCWFAQKKYDRCLSLYEDAIRTDVCGRTLQGWEVVALANALVANILLGHLEQAQQLLKCAHLRKATQLHDLRTKGCVVVSCKCSDWAKYPKISTVALLETTYTCFWLIFTHFLLIVGFVSVF